MAYVPLFTRLAGLKNQSPVPFSGARNAISGNYFNRSTRSDPESQMKAMSAVGTLFSCVDLTANAISQVNWHLYRKSRSGLPEDRVEVTSHLALDLWNKPNDFMTRQEFVETSQQHFELTGEAWWIVGRNEAFRSIPLSLWPARPDRMQPVPSPTEFLTGYLYLGPDDEKVPLALDEVVQVRRPHPLNPYRGLSSVQAILTQLDSAKASAEWNRNFFYNSAEPGGVIQVPDAWSDDEFNEFTNRWREQHQGVSNAHRIAVLENGAEWKQVQFTQRDMQYVELQNVTRDQIREVYRIHPHMLGQSADINLANALAADYTFAERTMKPRLERIKGALNNDFLPLFGTTGQGLEFDYDNPVPEDREADNAEITAKVNALVALKSAGFDETAACQMLGLPVLPLAQTDALPIGAGA